MMTVTACDMLQVKLLREAQAVALGLRARSWQVPNKIPQKQFHVVADPAQLTPT